MAAQPKTTRPRARTDPLPEVRPPSSSVLAKLSQQDRELLEKLLAEPPEFMDHPDLHKRRAEVIVFGETAKFVAPGIPRFQPCTAIVRSNPTAGSTIPTLSIDQERALFLRFNYARMRVCRILEACDGRRLRAKETREVLAWWHRALRVRAQIVRMNIPLVLAMAKRTRLHSIDFNELVSEGNMALLRSVGKFDCGRGFKFSTYSCRAILKSFSRVAMRASRYRGRFPMEFDPALEKDTYLEDKRQDLELDCVDELKGILVQNLADLSDVERTVILERFALNANVDPPQPKTLEQVGLIIGVTKERVRQIQNKALRKIRNALEDRYLAA
ncbi:MAG: sigma-70 family RNA polymerase sigma factor [Phycisphaerae bacterium]